MRLPTAPLSFALMTLSGSLSGSLPAQETPGGTAASPRSFLAKMQFDREYEPWSSLTPTLIDDQSNERLRGEAVPDRLYRGVAGRDIGIRVRVRGEDRSRCELTVDTDSDGDFRDEKKHDLDPKQEIRVGVSRPNDPEGRAPLPYGFQYQRVADRKGGFLTLILVKVCYRLRGSFRYRDRDIAVTFLDMNADGRFDKGDYRGSVLGLDSNADGEIRREFYFGPQLLPLLDRTLVLAEIAPDGSTLRFEESPLRIPKLGARLPSLEVRTDDGTSFDIAGPHPKPVLIYFWGHP